MGFFSSILAVTKSIVRSPVTQAAAGGLAIVFPPAGVPAAAAIATANQALALADSDKGKAIIGAGDRAAGAIAIKKKAAVKAQLVAHARAQVAAGIPRPQVKANLVHNAKRAAVVLKQQPAQAARYRQALAAQLQRTKLLASKGDVGAQRALSTFKLVSAARKGDPKSRAAVALIAHRWEVGQRVRSRFQLTVNGRIRSRV